MTVTPLRIPAQSPPCLPDASPAPELGACDNCTRVFSEGELDRTGCGEWLCAGCMDRHYVDFLAGCTAPECND